MNRFLPSENRRLKALHASTAAALLTVSLYPVLSSAHDTGIYFAKTSASSGAVSSVLFMFDTSGSMKNFDGTPYQRITRLKQAMTDVVSSADNVNIGIGAFNGLGSGGSILMPATNVNADLCPGAACDELVIRAEITSSSDDAEEDSSGTVELGNSTMTIDYGVDESTIVKDNYYSGASEDDAVEATSGGLDLDGDSLPMFYNDDALSTAFGETATGIRFPDVNIPVGATVLTAQLELFSRADETHGDVSAVISLDARVNAPIFADAAGQRVLDRPLHPVQIPWQDIPITEYDYDSVLSPSLEDLVMQAVNASDWTGTGDLAFVLQADSAHTPDASNRRGFFSNDGGLGAALSITYTTSTPSDALVGLRFSDLNVPRGATINHAVLKLTPSGLSGVPTQVRVVAEATDNAPSFTDTNNALSDRINAIAKRTATEIDWDIENWFTRNTYTNSIDIGPIINEITQRSGWCGGNAVAIFLQGMGDREIQAFEKDPWFSPALEVSYDPSSVDFNDTCVRKRVSSTLVDGTNDIIESSTDGAVDLSAEIVRTHEGTDLQSIGLRFSAIDVPAGATVSSAYLELTSAGYADGEVNMNITVENTGAPAAFNAASANPLTGRSFNSSSVDWHNVLEMPSGSSVRSPDLATLVQAIVDRPDWVTGNTMLLKLDTLSGSAGQRMFVSADAPGGDGGARLVVMYQHNGTDLTGSAIPLVTGRDELTRTMMNLHAQGSTPLVDMFYEAGQYMRGGAVAFGKKRGIQTSNENIFRTSSAASYTGGTLYRPPGCHESNLNDVACVKEEIMGNPVYDRPEFSQCTTNQIVLLSDGTPTNTFAKADIQTLTGAASCESRSVSGEECGIELAQWLFETDHDSVLEGTQGIVTHTVGFNFSSNYLGDIAAAGGGNFYLADSASELSQAFNNIIKASTSIDSSFVAPTASVSQTNRLVNSNDIYYGMFRPDTTTQWEGNLKKYQLAKNSTSGQIEILDALMQPAFDTVTGGVKDTSKSFWSNAADGNTVASGGAASQLVVDRNIYTSMVDASSGDIELFDFHENNTSITEDMLGLPGAGLAYRNSLLQWARGVDVKDYDEDGDFLEVRTQLGDPLHSTQFVLNYKISDMENKELIYMSTNEGFLHAIDTDSGTEEFAFIPEQLLPNLDYFYKDNVVDHDKRPYGLDGEISGWHDDANANGLVDDGEKAYIYLGMRRGGRNYYALDVSDPASPAFQWIIEGGSGHFAELGQTWSRAVKSRIKYKGSVKDVLIFAGGYDADKDTQTARAADDLGAAIFIVDALTGEYLTSRTDLDFSDMIYSIPSDVRVINIDSDGLADMLFVGDTGGQLWRFDIDNGAANDTAFLQGGVIADLGNDGVTDNRRFFYEPDVSLIRDTEGNAYLNIAIGSGFRAHPNELVVADRFYSIVQRSVFGPPRDTSGNVSYSASKVGDADLLDVSTASGRGDTSGRLSAGWYIDFADTGEKVLSNALTVDNTIAFTTYIPPATQLNGCSVSVGTGRVYSVDVFYGDPIESTDSDDSKFKPGDRYITLVTPGIPPRVSGLITEANPNGVTELVGLEVIDDGEAGRPFERTFWAEH